MLLCTEASFIARREHPLRQLCLIDYVLGVRNHCSGFLSRARELCRIAPQFRTLQSHFFLGSSLLVHTRSLRRDSNRVSPQTRVMPPA